jgi:hypothetical protein
MGRAAFVVIGVYSFCGCCGTNVVRCQIDVGTTKKGLSDPVCWKPGMVCVSKGESCMTNIGRHGVRDRLVRPGTWCCCMLLERWHCESGEGGRVQGRDGGRRGSGLR